MATDDVAPHAFASTMERFLSSKSLNRELDGYGTGGRTDFKESLREASFQVHFWCAFNSVYPWGQRASSKSFKVASNFLDPEEELLYVRFVHTFQQAMELLAEILRDC